jgi:hypothetical protein
VKAVADAISRFPELEVPKIRDLWARRDMQSGAGVTAN